MKASLIIALALVTFAIGTSAFADEPTTEVSAVSPAPAVVAAPAAPVTAVVASSTSVAVTTGTPVQVHYVTENTPVVITDSRGRAIEILYLKHAN